VLLYFLADKPSANILDNAFFLTLLGAGVTLLAGLIGAFVTYWVFRKQRSKKEISYQIISDAPIATVSKGYEEQV
jgi:hypothetical protein